jgi:magnesium chelatase family protein
MGLAPRQELMLRKLSINNGWSNREQIKIIRLARTIAVLKNKTEITEQHIWESIKLHGWKSLKTVSKRYREASIDFS